MIAGVELRRGDQVRLHFKGKKKPRQGTVVGLYDKFFNVNFGKYRESFLWVDLITSEVQVIHVGKRSASQAS